MERIYVSIGSNIDREYNVAGSLRALHERFGALAVSTVYECPAVGFEGDDFYNLVVGFDSGEPVTAVNSVLHTIEDRFDRDRRQPKFSPRTLDIDLLLYGDHCIESGKLVVPRPEIDRVAFVLGPLAELAGDRIHPLHGVPLRELWAQFDGLGAGELRRVDPAGIVPPEVLA